MNLLQRRAAPAIGLGVVVAAVALAGVGVAVSGAADPSHPGSLRAGPQAAAAPLLSATLAPQTAAPAGRPPAAGPAATPAASTPVVTATATATAPAPAVTTAAQPTVASSAGVEQRSPAAGAGQKPTKPAAKAARSSAAKGATTAPAATAAGPGPAAAPGAGAAPGNYTESTTGTATYTGGSMPVNGTATLTVDPAQGQAQTQTAKSENSSQVEKLVFGTGRVDATELSITSQIIDADFVLSPQEPLVELTPGATWSWKADSTDGKEHLALSGSYAGTEQVTVGGRAETAAIVKTTLTLTGSIATTITQTDDYDPAVKLILREHSITKGTYSGINYTIDTTTTLSSLQPS